MGLVIKTLKYFYMKISIRVTSKPDESKAITSNRICHRTQSYTPAKFQNLSAFQNEPLQMVFKNEEKSSDSIDNREQTISISLYVTPNSFEKGPAINQYVCVLLYPISIKCTSQSSQYLRAIVRFASRHQRTTRLTKRQAYAT